MLPILLFINSNEEESLVKNIIYAVLFGLILIPKDFYYFFPGDGLVLNNYTSISVIINPILIYTLTVFLFFELFVHLPTLHHILQIFLIFHKFLFLQNLWKTAINLYYFS